MQIRQIIDKIDDSQIFVPAFQREYVWKRPDAKALFTSLIKRYPTGTLLTWETTNPPELKGKKKYTSEMGSVKLILDGQQRITTIYMILEGKLPPYYTQPEIKNNVLGLYVNLETLDLEYYKKQAMQNNPLWVDLTDIFKGEIRSSDIRIRLREKELLNAELENLVDDNFEAVKSIKDREFPEQIIPVSASIKEAIDIFYIVNASGVNLTDAELALAQISGYWPEARDLFKAKLFELGENGFVFKLDFLIFALLAVTHSMGSEMKRLHSSDNIEAIKTAWKRLDTQILDYITNILRTHAFVDHSDEINSVFALIPLILYVYKKPSGQMTEDEINKAVKWFYYSQLRQRYASQTPQKLDKDLAIVKNSTQPFDDLLGLIEQERSLTITDGEFVGRDIRHPLFSLMRWYFKSKGAVCLTSGVSIRGNMGKKYSLEKDHIFPYAALKANGYDTNNRFKYALAQEVTNRAVLASIENRGKSDQAARKYLEKASNQFPSALRKQCIPEDSSLWEIENFESFLNSRRALLSDELNSFLSNITEMQTTGGAVSISDIIAEGEHDGLEFKSSMRWDTEQNCLNKALEKVVLKTVAAFNNGYGEGGRLIIGVDDDGNILGLDNDLSTLKGDDADAYELHLRNILNSEFGVEYAASSIKIHFHEISGQEVCSVVVAKGATPLFVKSVDKNGVKGEDFFVRSGNLSEPMKSTSEISAYIANRF
ncbi:MAG: DUF262 domain-containing protein [Proteobacteria bacterium]|jgi:uncharacterized protein with ParB-like and HNH nuclease domain|nr:DUF262 domain-containing protein [Pseudomonadota bacterium]MBT7561387.1 DUF262 domain-containing protein [Pseudomonadota bacterium]